MRTPACLVVVAIVLSAPAVHAEEGPVADERASAFACTGDTLVQQKRCYLEGEVLASHDAAAQAKENAAQAALLARKACRSASTVSGAPDADLAGSCEKEFDAAAQTSCTLDGETPLFDEKGRFSPKARDCYDALGTVIRRTRTMAATTVACCRCLATRCAGAPKDTCHRDLFEGLPSAEAKACFAKNACASECGAVATKAAEPAESHATTEAPEVEPETALVPPAKVAKPAGPPRKWY